MEQKQRGLLQGQLPAEEDGKWGFDTLFDNKKPF
jgi:hypothetical protein